MAASYIVYRVTNLVNGKVYFGKSNDLARRKREHLSEMYRERRNSHLYSAMRKYGRDNFIFEVLHTFECEEDAYLAEIAWIRRAGSMDPKVGYNLTPGGEGVREVSAQERKRRSDLAKTRVGPLNSFFGRSHSAETKARMREAAKGRPHPTQGTPCSEATKLKISNANKGERAGNAKLTNEQATSLRREFEGGLTVKRLQARYGLSKSAVRSVLSRRTYKEAA